MGYKDRKSKERTESPEGLGNAIYGRNAVKELLSSERDIEKLFIQRGEREGSIKVIIACARDRKIPIIEGDKAKLDIMCSHANHQGVVAVASEAEYSSVDEILGFASEKGECPFVIVLDGVEDPHNLGAIIRSAECAGAHGVIIPKRRAVGLTATVAKSSAGALSHMRVARVTNIASTIEELKEKGLWVFLADMGGDEFYNSDMTCPTALVLGSEGFGASRLVKEKCDFTVSIPLYGRVNSMNVSCAAAVIMTEIARQRNTSKAKA